MLNAFRHQRFGHSQRPTVALCTPIGAQRLSASKVWTHETSLSTAESGATCSTPFGIKGLDTFPFSPAALSSPVLNAFRHQRFGHRSVPQEHSSVVCAQRLSASKVWTPLHIVIKNLGGVLVLNAFRHQRFGHGASRHTR